MSMRRLSVALAMGRPNSALMHRAMRWALAKSASRSSRESEARLCRSGARSRSATAPLVMRPTVGWLSCLLTPAASRAVAADGERSLSGGVDLAVFAAQGGEQQGSAFERFGVADGGDDHVHLGAGAGEGGHGRGDGDGGDVFDGDGGGSNLKSHAQQEVGEHLGGEDGLLLVSGAVQADDQAVAHDGVFAHALDGGDLADAHLARGGRRVGGGPGEVAETASNRVAQSNFIVFKPLTIRHDRTILKS